MRKAYTPEERSVCRIVGTPIGNLSDLTFRAVKALEEADVVYAEDTRTARALLSHLNISKPVESYHKDNERAACDSAIKAIGEGKKIVLISEAGMPGVSDPGYYLIRKLMEDRLPFEVVPGVSAGVHGAVASGLCEDGRYIFAGFVAQKGLEKSLEEYADIGLPVVFYESPNRVKNTLKLILKYFKPPVAVCRELTKLYEEVFWVREESDLSLIVEKGEFCIVTGAGESKADLSHVNIAASEFAKILENAGVSRKIALDIMKECGVKRNIAYDLLNKSGG